MPERTDRELLELAAKAAGLGEVWYLERSDTPYIGKKFQIGMPIEYKAWNPLTNDGDALRLAVRLGIDVGFGFDGDAYERVVCALTDGEPVYADDYGGDACAATRRAIVRAAAEIGANMQS